MKIAVLGSPGEMLEAIGSLLAEHLPHEDCIYFEADGICREALPGDTDAAFVLVEDMGGLHTLRTMAELYPLLPITLVSHTPDYALEAIRQNARDYLILPIESRELARALRRMNLPGGKGARHVHASTG